MHRFFLPPDSFVGTTVRFPAETANQIRRVLRLQEGERVVALDNLGRAAIVEISFDGKTVQGRIVGDAETGHEPPCRLTLLTPLTRREKFEWVLQKCTEAGVSRFLPTISERSLVRTADDAGGKRERWEKILREAAEQSRRDRIPELMDARTFADALTVEPDSDALRILFWEKADDVPLRGLIEGRSERGLPADIFLAVGPEGGFSAEEAERARTAGWRIATLGKRILRLETAAIAAAILTNYILGS